MNPQLGLIILTLFLLAIPVAAVVLFACMRSSQISRDEERNANNS